MTDKYCSSMIHQGKKISGGAARNVRIKNAGGLEKMIDFSAKSAAILTAQQFMGATSNTKLKNSQ